MTIALRSMVGSGLSVSAFRRSPDVLSPKAALSKALRRAGGLEPVSLASVAAASSKGSVMRQSSGHRPTSVGNSPRDIGERLARFLRERHPQKTALSVAAETDIPASTVEKLIERCSAPSATTLWALIRAYGAQVVEASFPDAPEWISEAAHRQRIAEAEAALDRAKVALDKLKTGGRAS